MIDAGSSGSRAYLYGWPSHSGDMHELLKIRPLVSKAQGSEEPLVEKASPGLSRFLYFVDSNANVIKYQFILKFGV